MKIFPNIQPQSPLVQLEAIFSHPTSSHLGEKAKPHLAKTSFLVIVESDKVSLEPPIIQTEQLHSLSCSP